MARAIDYYQVLEVDPRAGTEVIHKAYRTLAAHCHPDATGHAEDAERMRRLNEAYATLSDPIRRAAYDRWRAKGLASLFYEEGLVGLARRWLSREGLLHR